MLRIISFTVTQLPGPNYHCRGGEPTAVREMPEKWWGHIVVDIGRQVSRSCTLSRKDKTSPLYLDDH